MSTASASGAQFLAFRQFQERWLPVIEADLRSAIPPANTRPRSLHSAMRHSLLAGGKRVRPLLLMATAESCGGNPSDALPCARAIELVHTYSLVHDDLPCMDDDDLRRGRPTCHKVFGEAVALLAGDALLTAAFASLAKAHPTPRHPTADFVSELARAAGSRALIAGQVADMEAENRPFTRSDLRFIHEGKTASMLVACARLGAMSANATPALLRSLSDFARLLGLAFQAMDDILDVTQPSEILGKSAGKDIVSGKATYPALLGIDGARREARRLTAAARRSLRPLGAKADLLHSFASVLLDRVR